MIERYNQEIQAARLNLANSCRDGLKKLQERGYKNRGDLYIGEVSFGHDYRLKKGKIYEHLGSKSSNEVVPDEVPFERFDPYADKGEVDLLVRAAGLIEGILERSDQARARSAKAALPTN